MDALLRRLSDRDNLPGEWPIALTSGLSTTGWVELSPPAPSAAGDADADAKRRLPKLNKVDHSQYSSEKERIAAEAANHKPEELSFSFNFG